MTHNTLVLNEDLVAPSLEAANRREALQRLVGGLKSKGYVDDEFLNQAVQREEEYPTGLRFENIAIAIPHASPAHVHTSACAIGRCASPVLFKNMEEPAEEIPVELICVLALKNPNDHLALMNRLMNLFADKSCVQAIRAAATGEELCAIFKAQILAG